MKYTDVSSELCTGGEVAMGADDPEERGHGLNGGPIRLLGYLKRNKRVAYVLAIMVTLHLSNQYDRQARASVVGGYTWARTNNPTNRTII